MYYEYSVGVVSLKCSSSFTKLSHWCSSITALRPYWSTQVVFIPGPSVIQLCGQRTLWVDYYHFLFICRLDCCDVLLAETWHSDDKSSVSIEYRISLLVNVRTQYRNAETTILTSTQPVLSVDRCGEGSFSRLQSLRGNVYAAGLISRTHFMTVLRIYLFARRFLPCDCECIRTVLLSTSVCLSVRLSARLSKSQTCVLWQKEISTPYDTAMFIVSWGQISWSCD